MKLKLIEGSSKIVINDNGCIMAANTYGIIGASCVVRVRYTIHYGKDGYIERRNFDIYSEGKCMPEITFEDGFWSNEKPEFKIQTMAYGAKSVDEVKKVVDGYQEAINIVNLLTDFFL